MSNPKIQALEFLLHENGLPWKENQMWAVYDETQPDNFRIERVRPSDDESYIDISDVKQWYLRAANGGESTYRTFPRTKKRLNVGKTFEHHVKWVLEHIPKEYRSKNLTILSPTFTNSKVDKESSKKYWGVFDSVAQDLGFVSRPGELKILPESEMTTAYFVHTRRDVVLKKEREKRQTVMLTIDLGASTTDLTVVRSSAEGELKSKSRDLADARKINTVKGATKIVAGNWVDEQIAKELGIYDQIELDRSLLKYVERAKVEVSKQSIFGPYSSRVDGFSNVSITTEVLERVTKRLVLELKPAFESIAKALLAEFKNQAGMLEKMKNAHQLEGDVTADNILQLLDYVFLAGGTSQLHGLAASLKQYLGGERAGLNMISVGPSFPLATTVGAGLNELAQASESKKGERFVHDVVQLNGTLPADVYFDHKIGKMKPPATKLFDRGHLLNPEPVVGEGRLLNYQNQRLRSLEGRIRVGSQSSPFKKSMVQTNNQIHVTPCIDNNKIRLQSDQLEKDAYTFDLWKYERRNTVVATQDGLDVQEVEELVVDIGMSKTVIALITQGRVTFNTLNQEVAKMSERSKVVQKPKSPVEFPKLPEKKPEPITTSSPSPQLQSSPHPKIPETTSDITMLPKNEFWSQLQAVRSAAKGLQMDWASIAKVLLSLSARDQAFLAGPPGAGKSFTSRVVSHLLGRTPDESYFEIPVQSHWENDDALFGSQGVLTSLEECDSEKGDRLILFDEINLTEPERYLMRCLQSMSSEFVSTRAKLQLPSIYILGTLNIDGSSRPPSPKMLDRFGLIEFEPQNPLEHKHLEWKDVQNLTASLGLIQVDKVSPLDKRLIEVVNGVFETVAKDGLQSDFLPSRRVADYLKKVWSMVEGTNMHGILSKDQVVDWLISTQILTRIAGPEEHVKPLIEWFQSWLTNNPNLPLTKRRIALYERQLTLGFVSPWQ